MSDYTRQINHYRQVMELSEQTRNEVMTWVFELLRSAEYWDGEYRHAAMLLQLTLTKKWRAGQ